MPNKQNKEEYERCKEVGLLHRIDIKLLKEYGTEEEIAAREGKVAAPKEEPKPAAKPKAKGKK